jgi:hypothetical protein
VCSRCVAGWAMNRAGRRAGRLLGACLGAGLLGRWYLLCLRRSVPWSVYFRWTHDDGSTFEYRAHILWIRDRTGLRRTSGERGRVRSACGHHSRVRKCGDAIASNLFSALSRITMTVRAKEDHSVLQRARLPRPRRLVGRGRGRGACDLILRWPMERAHIRHRHRVRVRNARPRKERAIESGVVAVEGRVAIAIVAEASAIVHVGSRLHLRVGESEREAEQRLWLCKVVARQRLIMLLCHQ